MKREEALKVGLLLNQLCNRTKQDSLERAKELSAEIEDIIIKSIDDEIPSDAEKILNAMNDLTGKLDYWASKKVMPEVEIVKDIASKYTTKNAMTRKEELEKKLSEVKEHQFQLNMKEKMTGADWTTYNALSAEIREIEKELESIEQE